MADATSAMQKKSRAQQHIDSQKFRRDSIASTSGQSIAAYRQKVTDCRAMMDALRAANVEYPLSYPGILNSAVEMLDRADGYIVQADVLLENARLCIVQGEGHFNAFRYEAAESDFDAAWTWADQCTVKLDYASDALLSAIGQIDPIYAALSALMAANGLTLPPPPGGGGNPPPPPPPPPGP